MVRAAVKGDSSMDKSEQRFSWGVTEEDFYNESLNDLLNFHNYVTAGEIVFFGRIEEPSLSDFISISDILEKIDEQAYEEFGDRSEGFACITKEQQDDLWSLMNAWYKRTFKPSFYHVVDIKEYTVTQADIDEARLGGE
jgi:hypothetical protein